MRKYTTILIVLIGLALCGCGHTTQTEMPVSQEEKSLEVEISVMQDEKESEPKMPENSFEDMVNTDVVQGGSYVYKEESQISEIAVSFSLKNITPTGATLVFHQYNANAPKGELIYGEDFVIEVLENGEWEKAPIPIEGNYAFHDIGIMLPCENISEREVDWEWLYGELEPGEYRIGKSILDSVESGIFDKYMVYAYFVVK